METWVLAEFKTPHHLLDAARKMREAGHTSLDAYTPYPVHGTDEALGLKRSKVPMIAATGAILGAATGFGMIWYANAYDYAINIAGRPTFSWPTFIPITFELAVLTSALFIFFGLMALFGLPRLHHPVFEVAEFASASTHAFWLSVVSEDAAVPDRLKALGATHVSVVRDEEER
jgi:hypothetical protein